MTIIQIVKRVSGVFFGGLVLLAWISCNESAPIVVSDEILVPSIIVSNRPNDFNLSVECRSYTDTLDYSLNFGTDSLFHGLVVSGASTGALLVQLLGSTGLVLRQDSASANSIQSKHIKGSTAPAQARLIFRGFTGTAVFTLIALASTQQQRTIPGAWEWAWSSVEAPFPRNLTPQTEGYTCQVYFLPDSTFAMFKDDSVLICRGAYFILSEYSIAVTQTKFPFLGLRMAYYFSGANELMLWPDITATDLPQSVFHRRTQ